MVEIVTQWPGHAAEEVERLITVPVEIEMNGMPRMTVIRSISLYGLSDVRLTFEDGTDNYFARQQVFERLPDVELPDGVTPSVSPLFSPSGLVYRYVLESPDRTPMELKIIQDWVIERQYPLGPRRGGRLAAWAARRCSTRSLLDPAKLAGAGLSVPDVVDGARRQQQQRRRRLLLARAASSTTCAASAGSSTPEDIGNVVLAVHNGMPVLVKDVGHVVIGHAPRLGQFGFNEHDDAVEGVVLHAHGRAGADRAQAASRRRRGSSTTRILPKDVKVRPFYDRSELIALTTRTVEDNLLRGIVLVVVVLIFFLYDVRSGLIVAVTIPLSLLFAFICLDLRHIPANLLSIGAIDFGILVDGAVVMVENIYRQLALRARNAVRDPRGHRRGGGRGGPADLLRGGGDRRELPADLRADRALGRAVLADGGHHDLRADRLAAPDADAAAGALRLGAAQGRARAAQPGVRVDPGGLRARPRLRAWRRPRATIGVAAGALRGSRCC